MLPDLEPTDQSTEANRAGSQAFTQNDRGGDSDVGYEGDLPRLVKKEAEIEPIQPQEAERILADALKPYLADGWRVLHQNAYSARLTRGLRNKDLQVDLLGRIEVQESNLTPVQDSGRLTAWIFCEQSVIPLRIGMMM
jgi:hypothetical protein